jgi:hypothetical protein
LRVEGVRALPQPDEDLLGDVLRGGAVAGHPQGHRVDQRGPAVIGLGKRVIVPRDEALP